MNNMMKKLRSDKGASITFGLLLFMVCAVLCTVIIVAATTASGRLANMAEADQRYYSVTSACGLLEELLDEQEVTVVTVTEGGETTSYLVPGKSGAQAATSYSEDQRIGDNFSADTIAEDAAYRYSKGKPAAGSPLTGTISLSSAALGDAVAVTIHEQINRRGDIILTVSNVSDGNPFSMQMTFTADVSEEHYSKESNSSPGDTPAKDTDTLTMQWNLAGVKTVSESGAGL